MDERRSDRDGTHDEAEPVRPAASVGRASVPGLIIAPPPSADAPPAADAPPVENPATYRSTAAAPPSIPAPRTDRPPSWISTFDRSLDDAPLPRRIADPLRGASEAEGTPWSAFGSTAAPTPVAPDENQAPYRVRATARVPSTPLPDYAPPSEPGASNGWSVAPPSDVPADPDPDDVDPRADEAHHVDADPFGGIDASGSEDLPGVRDNEYGWPADLPAAPDPYAIADRFAGDDRPVDVDLWSDAARLVEAEPFGATDPRDDLDPRDHLDPRPTDGWSGDLGRFDAADRAVTADEVGADGFGDDAVRDSVAPADAYRSDGDRYADLDLLGVADRFGSDGWQPPTDAGTFGAIGPASGEIADEAARGHVDIGLPPYRGSASVVGRPLDQDPPDLPGIVDERDRGWNADKPGVVPADLSVGRDPAADRPGVIDSGDFPSYLGRPDDVESSAEAVSDPIDGYRSVDRDPYADFGTPAAAPIDEGTFIDARVDEATFIDARVDGTRFDARVDDAPFDARIDDAPVGEESTGGAAAEESGAFEWTSAVDRAGTNDRAAIESESAPVRRNLGWADDPLGFAAPRTEPDRDEAYGGWVHVTKWDDRPVADPGSGLYGSVGPTGVEPGDPGGSSPIERELVDDLLGSGSGFIVKAPSGRLDGGTPPAWLMPEPPDEEPEPEPPPIGRVRASARVPGLLVERPPADPAPAEPPPPPVVRASAAVVAPPPDPFVSARLSAVADSVSFSEPAVVAAPPEALQTSEAPEGWESPEKTSDAYAGLGDVIEPDEPVGPTVTQDAYASLGTVIPPGDGEAEPPPAETPYSSEDWRSNVRGTAVVSVESAGTVYRGETEEEPEEDEPISTAQRVLRYSVVLALLVLFVVAFIYGPKIDQWFTG